MIGAFAVKIETMRIVIAYKTLTNASSRNRACENSFPFILA